MQATVRVQRPHAYFPFDLFRSAAAEDFLDDAPDLKKELAYVRDHCMVPPYPWGQIVYHDFIVANLVQEVPGDFAEFGIGQGGMSVFLARLAKKYRRKFLAVDSFEGLPPPSGKDNHYFLQGDYRPKEGMDNYEAFLKYKSWFDIDDTMHVVKAFFRDVEMPSGFDKFAFVHLDSDLYDSVYDSLAAVWNRLSEGGCIAVDDFFHHAQGPARAVSDFFREREAQAEPPPLLFVVPTYAVLIVKGRSACVRLKDQPSPAYAMHGPRALDGNFYSFVLLRQCRPFLAAARRSLELALKAKADAELAAEADNSSPGKQDVCEALRRVATNAESFVAFLEYDENGPRSGVDIMRYLVPLEDLFDQTQGRLCGVPGEARPIIEIGIGTSPTGQGAAT